MNGASLPKRFTAASLINAAGPLFGLILVLGLFSLSSEVRPYLFTGANFKIVLIQTVIVAVGALGMTMIIVSGGIDLSVGSTVALTSVLGATLLVKGFSPLAAFGLTILAGGIIGLLNGSMVAFFRMMPFIVTLGHAYNDSMIYDGARGGQMDFGQPNGESSGKRDQQHHESDIARQFFAVAGRSLDRRRIGDCHVDRDAANGIWPIRVRDRIQ